jgi:hypothetical protein
MLYLVNGVGHSNATPLTTTIQAQAQAQSVPTDLFHTTPEVPASEIDYTSKKLYDVYETNEVATDLRIRGKIVNVTGTVTSINKNAFDQPYITLDNGSWINPTILNIKKQDEAKVAKLRKGQRVYVSCPKMKRWAGSPWGEDCTVDDD